MDTKKRRKRGRSDAEEPVARMTTQARKRKPGDKEKDEDDLAFEDPFEDSFEEEEVEEGEGEEDEDMACASGKQVWRPGVDEMGKDEVLDYDPAAYRVMHSMHVEWPCLSFDIISDHLGEQRSKAPYTVYFATGTQADGADKNKLLLLKASDLAATEGAEEEEDSDDGASNSSDVEGDPVLEYRQVAHEGAVNRLRCMPQQSSVMATWADNGKVHVWDMSAQLRSLDEPPRGPLGGDKPVTSFTGHADEGFALAWSRVVTGRLITGDCAGKIHLWEKAQGGRWAVDKVAFEGGDNGASVEDLQWSPVQADVFASCSVDGSVRIWDARTRDACKLRVAAHETDVNVISWNRMVAHLLVSGGDDGVFNIWDLRKFASGKPAQFYKWHKGPITSVDWHPTDTTCLGVSGADNQITLWDMSLESDAESTPVEEELGLDVPPQLMFVHQGQTDIKEIHWHAQVPGLMISTALDGFNIFRAVNF